MKKLLFAILLVFTFSSCGLIDDAFRDEPVLTSETGILTEQIPGDEYVGTHLLTDGVTVTPLQSLTINLSSRQYLGNRVQLMGFLNEENGVFEVTGVSVLELTDQSVAQVSFATYRNTDWGIQLKYYDDWELTETDDEITFFAPALTDEADNDMVTILQFPFDSPNSSISDFTTQFYPEITNPSFHQIGADNLDAFKLEIETPNVDYFLLRDDMIYQLSFVAGENFIAANKRVFNEMVSEFRFVGFTVEAEGAVEAAEEISTDDSAELPAFESLPYHFTAQYPQNWYYAGSRGAESNILRHYGFSDEPLTDENEILSLDVISDASPSSTARKVYESGGILSIYITIDGQNYRVRGDSSYESIMLSMTGSITPVVVE